MVANTRIQTGKLISPFGTSYVGFMVTIGGVVDPAMIERTYEDIDRIIKSNPEAFHMKEERDKEGKFIAYHVSTEPIEDGKKHK